MSALPSAVFAIGTLNAATAVAVGTDPVAYPDISSGLLRVGGRADFVGGAFRITRGSGSPATISLRYAGTAGTPAAPTAPPINTELSRIAYQGWDATDALYREGARVSAFTGGTAWSHTNYGTRLEFWTTHVNSIVESLHGYVTGDGGIVAQMNSDVATECAFHWTQRSRGVINSETQVQSGDTIGAFVMAAWNGVSDYLEGASIASLATGDWSTSSFPTKLQFRVTASGSITPLIVLYMTPENPLLLPKSTLSAVAPGDGKGSLRFEAGTNAGTLKLVARSGTSATGVTVLDNIGSGNS